VSVSEVGVVVACCEVTVFVCGDWVGVAVFVCAGCLGVAVFVWAGCLGVAVFVWAGCIEVAVFDGAFCLEVGFFVCAGCWGGVAVFRVAGCLDVAVFVSAGCLGEVVAVFGCNGGADKCLPLLCLDRLAVSEEDCDCSPDLRLLPSAEAIPLVRSFVVAVFERVRLWGGVVPVAIRLGDSTRFGGRSRIPWFDLFAHAKSATSSSSDLKTRSNAAGACVTHCSSLHTRCLHLTYLFVDPMHSYELLVSVN
jgi:hypothetical protein